MIAGNYTQDTDRKNRKSLVEYHGIYEGIVKRNADSQGMGRLQVWVPELGSTENDEDGWVVASYLSPFGGATDPSITSQGTSQSYEGTQKSYGFWAIPPDAGNRVAIMFLNGEPSRAIWIGCFFQQYANTMVPNIPVSSSYQYDGKPVPTAETNRRLDVPTANNTTRPYNKPQYEAMRNQGLADDPIRGYSQHGATSDPLSKVYGLLTPAGHYWSMEDTDNDQKIRIRTAGGAQLLLDDTNNIIYLTNKAGNAWVEMDKDGKIMFYSDEGIGFRSARDVSIVGDRDIIFEAGRNIVTKAGDNIFVETNNYTEKVSGIMNTDIAGKRQESVGNDYTVVTGEKMIQVGSNFVMGGMTVNINSDDSTRITSNTDMNIFSNTEIKVGSKGSASFSSQSTTNMIAGGTLVMAGPKLVQNTGGRASPPDASPPSVPSYSPVPERPSYDRQDVYQPQSDNNASYRTVRTIASIYPTHEPSVQHGSSPSNRDESSNDRNTDAAAGDQQPIIDNSVLMTKDEFMQSLMDDIRRHEGVIYRVYPDPIYGNAKPTGGVGHLLTAAENSRYRMGESLDTMLVEQWFFNDVTIALNGCQRIYGSAWTDGTIPDEKRQVLANMCFNMGEGGLRNFNRMNGAILAQNWSQAAAEMSDSLWYNQVGNRSRELVSKMLA